MKKGFTLIELLVVVLIIGILAAVALPQYQVAVKKSRFVSLQIIGDALAKSDQAYFLANGELAATLDQFDMLPESAELLRSKRCFELGEVSCFFNGTSIICYYGTCEFLDNVHLGMSPVPAWLYDRITYEKMCAGQNSFQQKVCRTLGKEVKGNIRRYLLN